MTERIIADCLSLSRFTGAFLFDNFELFLWGSSDLNDKVVNSVGAGDSMVAGFVAGYQQSGGDYAAALKLGTACGSATAFSLGLATKEKIAELMQEI